MDKAFIDSNIWIYAFITTDNDLIKREICISLLENLYQEKIIVVSTQVINEVHWNLVSKYELKDEEAKLKIDLGVFRISELSILNKATYDYAFTLRQQYNISFWDSLIVTSALESDCSIIYTEDLQHNQMIENQLKVINPFISGSTVSI
ncbi:PIN domain-containing protein [Candidatus Halobeggiatoa sp. HSG11]|nr:PIN domain-containing protein [Candidatus Halobeggiatoa sp. HSG11]